MTPGPPEIRFLLPDGGQEAREIGVRVLDDAQTEIECDVAPPGRWRGEDFWDAFRQFQRAAEKAQRLPICAGARVDFGHSGMSRQMSGGRMGYLLDAAGNPCSPALDALAPAEADRIGTSAQAEAYRARRDRPTDEDPPRP